jgi:hypothetical protein
MYSPVFQKIPVRLLGPRFEARNCIIYSEPCPQEPYSDFFWKHPVIIYFPKHFNGFVNNLSEIKINLKYLQFSSNTTEWR